MPPPPGNPDDRRIHGVNGVNGSSNGSNKNKRNLSEISHLFLSDLRTANGHAPERRPPSPPPAPPAPPPVRAVLSAQLDGDLARRAAGLAAGVAARSLAQGGRGRVGLAVIEASALRIGCVEADAEEGEGDDPVGADGLADAVRELSCDVDAWVIALPDARLPHARRLLGRCPRWTLLTAADHEGVVGGYRTLKALGDEFPGENRPTVTVAACGEADDARRAAAKLAGVCRQFLDLEVGDDPDAASADAPPGGARSFEVVAARWPTCAAAADAWATLEALLFDCPPENQPAPEPPAMMNFAPNTPPITQVPEVPEFPDDETPTFRVDESSIPPLARPSPKPAAAAVAEPPPMRLATPDAAGEVEEVIDLPPGSGTAGVVEAAARSSGDLAITPVCPPMLPAAKLAVDREGRAVLLAAAEPGLAELSKLGRAMAWVAENRQLLAMALQQYRLANDGGVAVRLYVAHADANAGELRPLLGSAEVSVRTYRRLRWAGREGVLLDAA